MKKLSILAALMVVAAGVAFASTLNVPFFKDTSSNGTTGVIGSIGLKETSGVARTVTVIYTALNTSGLPQTQQVTFAIGANEAFKWGPVQSRPQEASGSRVGNMTIVGGLGATTNNQFGSAEIISAGTLSGAYFEKDTSVLTEFAFALIPE